MALLLSGCLSFYSTAVTVIQLQLLIETESATNSIYPTDSTRLVNCDPMIICLKRRHRLATTTSNYRINRIILIKLPVPGLIHLYHLYYYYYYSYTVRCSGGETWSFPCQNPSLLFRKILYEIQLTLLQRLWCWWWKIKTDRARV